MALPLTINVSQLPSWLNKLGAQLTLKNPRKALAACAIAAKTELKKMMQASVSPDGTPYKPLKFPRPNGKTKPLWDTGALVRSVSAAGAHHVETIKGSELEIGTNMIYAPLHQYGGTVKPVKGKFLSIPLTIAAKRAGSPRNFPMKLKAIIGKSGKGVLVGATPKKRKGQTVAGKVAAQYALVKQVKVPPRPFVGWSPKMIADVETILMKQALGIP